MSITGLAPASTARCRKLRVTPFKLILGHSGWTAGQLEKEIENGDWLIQSTTEDFIFKINPEEMWKQAAGSLGVNIGATQGISGQA